MHPPAPETNPELSPPVRTVLVNVRRRIRRYVCVEGFATALAWLGIAFWGTLAIDWFFEPSHDVRRVLLTLVGLAFMSILVRLVAMRAFIPLRDSSMATLLERRFPHLNDTLLTAVLLTERGVGEQDGENRDIAASCDPSMLARTCREATRRIERVDVAQLFDPAPLRRSIAAAVLLALSVAGFAIAADDLFDVWVKRTLQLDRAPWPRDSRLMIEGFETGTRNVARGSDLELLVKAHMAKEEAAPLVELRYRSEGGRRRRVTMDRLGIAEPRTDTYQNYAHTFEGILSPMRLDIVGGDDRIEGLRVRVVESPTIAEMAAVCEFPPYMNRSATTMPITSLVEIPQGTKTTLHCQANKDLARVRIDTISGGKTMSSRHISPEDLSDDARSITHVVPSVDTDTMIQLTLTDTDGISSREPVSIELVPIEDRPPEIDARLTGIGSAVTPSAHLPVAGTVSDDYGVADIWFDYTISEGDAKQHAIASLTAAPIVHDLRAELDLAELGVAAEQKLLVGVKASDSYDLEGMPQVGRSQRWMLDVVTSDQLRILLEARELVLRQRFERITEEVAETRDLLRDMSLRSAPQPTAHAEVRLPAEGDAARPTDEEEQPAHRAAAHASTTADAPLVEMQKQEFSRRALYVRRALQDSRKNAHETAGVADAFDDIRMQLINNRIDTRELTTRLDQQIAGPLRDLASDGFTELERRLLRLSDVVEDEPLATERRDLAVAQLDDILLSMHRILDRMLELEDFNKAVELLREIIALQEELEVETKQRRKDKLRDLLGD